MKAIRSPGDHFVGDDLMAADEHHHRADRADEERGHRAGGGDRPHRADDEVEQLPRALAENLLLMLLGGVGLDDADAGEAFRQPPGDVAIHLAALLEHRTRGRERPEHDSGEGEERQEDHRRQTRAEMEEEERREAGRDDAAEDLREPGADEIADSFGVVHDARDEHAGLGRVEVADRQALHVLLQPRAQIGDRALRGDAEDLRERVVGDAAEEGHARAHQRQLRQQRDVSFREHVVDRAASTMYGRTMLESRLASSSGMPMARRSARTPDDLAGILENGAEARLVHAFFLACLRPLGDCMGVGVGSGK